MSTGFKAKAGFLDAATWLASWDPAVTPVTTMIPMVSESLTTEYERLRSVALDGSAAEKISEQGIQLVTGDIVMELDYNNAGLLEYAMGSEAGGVHTLADDLGFFHLVIDRVYRRYAFWSCIVNTMTVSASAGDTEPVKVTLNVTARIAGNITTAFPAISLTTPNRAYWDHIADTGFIVDDIANVLSTADNKAVKSVEIAVAHNLQTDGRDTSSNVAVIQPIRNGWRKVTAKFGLSRFGSDQLDWYDWKVGDYAIYWQLSFVDAAESIVFHAPECKIVGGANFNVSGPGVIEDTVDLECHYNYNNGNSSVVDQLQVTVT